MILLIKGAARQKRLRNTGLGCGVNLFQNLLNCISHLDIFSDDAPKNPIAATATVSRPKKKRPAPKKAASAPAKKVVATPKKKVLPKKKPVKAKPAAALAHKAGPKSKTAAGPKSRTKAFTNGGSSKSYVTPLLMGSKKKKGTPAAKVSASCSRVRKGRHLPLRQRLTRTRATLRSWLTFSRQQPRKRRSAPNPEPVKSSPYLNWKNVHGRLQLKSLWDIMTKTIFFEKQLLIGLLLRILRNIICAD